VKEELGKAFHYPITGQIVTDIRAEQRFGANDIDAVFKEYLYTILPKTRDSTVNGADLAFIWQTFLRDIKFPYRDSPEDLVFQASRLQKRINEVKHKDTEQEEIRIDVSVPRLITTN
jgi:predicted secreted Zn-dependent protease